MPEIPPSPGPLQTAQVDREIRQITRRSFAVGALAAGAGALGWLGVRNAALEDGIPWPLRRVLAFNERVAGALFSETRLAAEFSSELATEPRANGHIGLNGVIDPASWRLQILSPDRNTEAFTLEEIKALPAVSMTTELRCIEGWSNLVEWKGVRLVDFAAWRGFGVPGGRPFAADRKPVEAFRYVRLETPTADYYVGLDMASAFHPQTLLCYEMNGRPLTPEHGAPLRLVIPVKYGIKSIKRIGAIRFSNELPGDYWAKQGYDWYAGL
jgi:DMSO/TMAO reductase YedYZ molybdopterin-dependent catalytic subunit